MREQPTRGAWYFLLTVTWAGVCPSGAQAQDAPYRPALAQLRAALDSVQAESALDRITVQWDSAASGTIRKLGRAYIQLQRGRLSQDRVELVSAWDDFSQVVLVHPDWPYAQLGLAIAGFELYYRGYTAPAIYDGTAGGTHYDGVVIELSRMLQEEPDFQPGTDWVANALASEGDRAQRGPLLQALRYVADSAKSSNPKLQLLLARAARLDGDDSASMTRIGAYLREGGDSGVAGLERARTLAAMDSLAKGAASYMAGANISTAAARDIYRLDLSWVASTRELVEFDGVPTDSMGAFIKRFWTKRDARELRPTGSRLQEHLRRWAYVNQNFRVSDPGRRTMLSKVSIPNPNDRCGGGQRTLDDYSYVQPMYHDYRSPERVFDHRAIVYMRHGEPMYTFGGDTTAPAVAATGRGSSSPMNAYDPLQSRLSQTDMMTVGAIGPQGPGSTSMSYTGSSIKTSIPASPITQAYADRNITWVYNIGGQIRAFTFEGHDALGTSSPTTLVVDQAPNLDVLLQLSAIAPSYAQVANDVQRNAVSGSMMPVSCTREYRQMVREQQEGAAVAVRTDSYVRQFTRPLTSMMQLAAMGQPEAGTGELVVALGVRMRDLQEANGVSNQDKAAFVVRIQLAAIDSLTGEAVTMDTVRGFKAQRDQQGWISFVTTLPLRPGLGEFRMSVAQGDDRGVLQSVSIAPATADFSASDLVLGAEEGPASWRRDGTIVPINPYSAYRTNESLFMYQELYGLTPGQDYRTTVSLRAARKGQKLKTALTFVDQATAATLSTSRQLALDGVKPGLYEVLVEVQEVSTGRSVRRERSIAVYAKP